MSFFTDELMKCTEEFEGRKCIGNAMYIPLGENNRLKLFFTTFGYADHYEGISISAVDKNNGVIDKNTIKFADIWGKKQVSNPNFRNSITPYIWKDGNQAEWYVYKPTPRDMELLADQINDYADLFMEQSMELQESPAMTMSM
ncbi:hypothetical protein [Anaerotignum sp. MB30-C6]|uniref:hypothetical protein n=1 Tax=Anaerotignum sp. MB30-C6 TaxID=3070814 RepID=UPI0027DB1C82|nr:hypothetical protein [Anaerotignum sp. MB30-C6]WMI82507.1 hypothetical protein RBQ60_07180 [Anaerotignum sp. MB30-C6]